MAALGSPSEHPLFLVSLPGALYSLQLEIGGPCAHLVESVVAAENEKSLAVPEQIVEATYFGTASDFSFSAATTLSTR